MYFFSLLECFQQDRQVECIQRRADAGMFFTHGQFMFRAGCIFPYTAALCTKHIELYLCERRPSLPRFGDLPTLKPGTKIQTSTRYVSGEAEIPQARPGALPRRRAGGPAPAHASCVEPRQLEVGAETLAVPSPGAFVPVASTERYSILVQVCIICMNVCTRGEFLGIFYCFFMNDGLVPV